MVVKNIEYIEKHLKTNGFEQAKATPHEWQKSYGINMCKIDLTGDKIVAIWSPLDDYTKASVDFSTKPMMLQVVVDIETLSESGELPDLIGRSKLDSSTKNDTVPPELVKGTEGREIEKEMPALKPPMPVPSIRPKSNDQTAKLRDSGSVNLPDTTNPLPDQKDVGGSIFPTHNPPPASSPTTKANEPQKPKSVPPVPFNSKDPMNSRTPSPPVPSKASSTRNPPVVVDAAELDRKMAEKQAENWLAGQGSTYNVYGNIRPDAASIQKAANKNCVSTEILSAVQTEKYAEVIVRTHLGGQYVDTVVHNDFENSRNILLLEMAMKHPEIVESYSNGYPVIKDGATISDSNGNVKNAMETIIHTLLSDIQFSIRDCTTKASAAGQAKILNKDWMGKTEKDSEKYEQHMVEQSKINKRK